MAGWRELAGHFVSPNGETRQGEQLGRLRKLQNDTKMKLDKSLILFVVDWATKGNLRGAGELWGAFIPNEEKTRSRSDRGLQAILARGWLLASGVRRRNAAEGRKVENQVRQQAGYLFKVTQNWRRLYGLVAGRTKSTWLTPIASANS